MLYDLLGDPLDAVLAHCSGQWLVALSRCSKPLQQQVEPFVRQAEEESERLLCECLDSTREELAGTDTVAWPAGLPEPQCRHLRAWLLPGYPLAHVTKLRIPNRQTPVTFRLPGATKLNLSGYYLGDPVVTVLAAPIATNATLPDLNLGCNKIGDEGGIAIGKALSVNASLKSLDLSYNKNIGDEGWIAIAKSLEVNASLTTLSFRDNALGLRGKDALRRTAMAKRWLNVFL